MLDVPDGEIIDDIGLIIEVKRAVKSIGVNNYP
jgi:hypothetical protein